MCAYAANCIACPSLLKSEPVLMSKILNLPLYQPIRSTVPATPRHSHCPPYCFCLWSHSLMSFTHVSSTRNDSIETHSIPRDLIFSSYTFRSSTHRSGT